MTYSIAAIDMATGELGVAVQSRYMGVGPVVPWVEAGVGAIATQSFANLRYGAEGLVLLREGATASEALERIRAADPGEATRQVGMVDAKGNVATHTGSACVAAAGHVQGEGFTCQANMMERETVPAAMARAFGSATGPFADRLLAALDAAEAEGGDIRGKQSAAIFVASGPGNDIPGDGFVTRLHVDDHPEPLSELRRLLNLHRDTEALFEAVDKIGAGDAAGAYEVMHPIAQRNPDEDQFAYWTAIAAAASGNTEEAATLFRSAVAANPRWVEMLDRSFASGMFPAEAKPLVTFLKGSVAS